MIENRDIINVKPEEMTELRPIEVITAEIQFYKNQAGEAILEIGHRLNEAKEQLQHGEWLTWLSEKVEFSEASAQRFMRLAREYSNPSPVTDLGTSKALVLLALPDVEREDFISEKHDINGEEKTVNDMSKRELEKVVRERNEALEKKAESERILQEQQQTIREAEDRAAEAKAEADRIQTEKSELELQLKELREQEIEVSAEPDQQTFEKIKKEAAAEAKKEAEKTLKKKIEKAAEDKTKAEAAQKEAEKALEIQKQERDREKASFSGQIETLQKKLTTANSTEITTFKFHFENAQTAINNMMTAISALDKAKDAEIITKFIAALNAMCQKGIEYTEKFKN